MIIYRSKKSYPTSIARRLSLNEYTDQNGLALQYVHFDGYADAIGRDPLIKKISNVV